MTLADAWRQALAAFALDPNTPLPGEPAAP
jgi:hypothetical protein